MSELIESIEQRQLRTDLPRFRVGDRVRVHFQVIEGNRRRTQVFEGAVIRLQGSGSRETFTVRKVSFGIGVERTFPVHSPKIERLEVVARGDVRRAKLYYLRGRIGRRARVRERRDFTGAETMAPEVPERATGAGPEADGAEAEAEPEATEPEAAETEAAEPETAEPEAAEPGAAEPQTAEPETAGAAETAEAPGAETEAEPEPEDTQAEATDAERSEPEAAAEVEEKS